MGWHTHKWVESYHRHDGERTVTYNECAGCDVKMWGEQIPPPPPPPKAFTAKPQRQSRVTP